MKRKKSMSYLGIRVPEKIKQKIDGMAEANHCSQSTIMRIVLEKFFENNSTKINLIRK